MIHEMRIIKERLIRIVNQDLIHKEINQTLRCFLNKYTKYKE